MRMHIFRWVAVFVLAPFALASRADEAAATVKKLQVTILSTMVVDYIGENEGLGEWGFSALIEADGRKILFDTGAHPDTVLHNAKALGLDLSGVTDVVLSHFHNDHTGGLLALRRELRKVNPHAMERAHIGHEFFWLRRADGRVWDQTIQLRKAYLEMGGAFVEHLHAEELFPGIWVTGEIPRRTDEHNFSKGVEVQSPDGNWVED